MGEKASRAWANVINLAETPSRRFQSSRFPLPLLPLPRLNIIAAARRRIAYRLYTPRPHTAPSEIQDVLLHLLVVRVLARLLHLGEQVSPQPHSSSSPMQTRASPFPHVPARPLNFEIPRRNTQWLTPKSLQHRDLPEPPALELLVRRVEHRHVQEHEGLVRRLLKLLLLRLLRGRHARVRARRDVSSPGPHPHEYTRARAEEAAVSVRVGSVFKSRLRLRRTRDTWKFWEYFFLGARDWAGPATGVKGPRLVDNRRHRPRPSTPRFGRHFFQCPSFLGLCFHVLLCVARYLLDRRLPFCFSFSPFGLIILFERHS